MALAKLTQIFRRRPNANLVAVVADERSASPARHMLDAYLEEARGQPENRVWAARPADIAAGRAILDSDRTLQPLIVCEAIARLTSLPTSGPRWRDRYALREVVAALCQRRLDYSADDLRQALV